MAELGPLVLAVAFAALAFSLTRLPARSLALPMRLAIALAAAVLGLGLHALWPRATPEAEVSNRPAQVAGDGYVSSSACRACHPSQYASWRASWHRTMTQVATPESVVGDFDDVTVHAYGRRYRLQRRGETFFAETHHPATGHRVEQAVVMTTGAHHEQDYWLDSGEGRRVAFLPLMYLVEDARWIPFTDGFLRPPVRELPPPEATDKWQFACIKCHATHGKPRDSSPEATPIETTVAELGIACEACHGPAARHVAENRDPLRRYRLHLRGDPDPTIVQPERLDAARASEVCGQCHGISKPLTDFQRGEARTSDWRSDGLRYRPGDRLEETRYVARPEQGEDPHLAALLAGDPHYLEDRFWPDGEVRVSGREYNGLVASPCFERGEGERKLSCLSCHDMHSASSGSDELRSWADDQLAPGMRGNSACLGCHQSFAEDTALVSHTRHPADSAGSECMNCHMPYTTYGLLKAIRSHKITSPASAATSETGRPDACSLCHLNRSVGWVAAELTRGWGVEAPPLPPVLERVPLSMVWSLAGDAGQRALFAWAMGWEPALEVSQDGQGWMVPFLAQQLLDPYAAVRYMAARSLRAQPGFEDLAFDFVAAPEARAAVAREVALAWSRARHAAGEPTDPRALIEDPEAVLPDQLFEALLSQRDLRRVDLAE